LTLSGTLAGDVRMGGVIAVNNTAHNVEKS
jgi:hypothetical protein